MSRHLNEDIEFYLTENDVDLNKAFKRMGELIEVSEFSRVILICKDIIQRGYEIPEFYQIMLLAETEVKTMNELPRSLVPLESCESYKKAIELSDEQTASYIRKCKDTVKKNIEKQNNDNNYVGQHGVYTPVKKKKSATIIVTCIIAIFIILIIIVAVIFIKKKQSAKEAEKSAEIMTIDEELSNKSEDSSDHEHDWTEATCTEPSQCSICQVTQGEPLGHTVDAGKCDRCKDIINFDLYKKVVGFPLDGTRPAMPKNLSNAVERDVSYEEMYKEALKDIEAYKNIKSAYVQHIQDCGDYECFAQIKAAAQDVVNHIPSSISGADKDSIVKFFEQEITCLEKTQEYDQVVLDKVKNDEE